MSDVVERLRELSGGTTYPPDAGEIIENAANEIERLRGEVVGLAAPIQFAKLIRVVRDGGRGVSLTIDGREFPWFVHHEGVSVGHIRKDDVPRVLVPIIAERVEIADSIDVAPSEPEHEDADVVARSHEAADRDDGGEEEPGLVRPPGPPARPDTPDHRPVG